MSDWQHGYASEIPYNYDYYREVHPRWLDWVAALRGVRPPRGKRFLDIGCGQGVSLCVLAAANPDYHFVGVDFAADHIAHARFLAEQAGLENVEFHEADILALAENPPEWARCDYAVAHGVLTWINRPVREALFRLLRSVMSPGALAYFSYNTLPGWLTAHPVQRVIGRLARHRGVNRGTFEEAMAVFGRLHETGAAIFDRYPGLAPRLRRLEKEASSQGGYVFHEYFHDEWTPFYVTDVADQAAVAKLSHVGSATLADNFEDMLDEGRRAFLATAPDAMTRELYKDLLLNQTFRRDVYVRGGSPLWEYGRLEWLAAQTVQLLRLPDDEGPLVFSTSYGEAEAVPEIYGPLLRALIRGPKAVHELMALPELRDVPDEDVIQAVSLLMHANVVGLGVQVETTAPCVGPAFNREIAALVAGGAPYRFAALPGIGSGTDLRELDWLALHAHYQGITEAEELVAFVDLALYRLGRAVMDENGEPVARGAESQRLIARHLKRYFEEILPMLLRLGGVNAGEF